MRPLIVASFLAATLLAPGALAQQGQPDTQGGRYMLREVEGDYLRVDRETGDTSICRASGSGWTCTLVADDRRAYEDELERLAEENAELADRVAMLRDEVARLRGEDATPDAGAGMPEAEEETSPRVERRDNEIILNLPSDEDLDQLSETFEAVMRRFVEMLRSLRSDLEQQDPQPDAN